VNKQIRKRSQFYLILGLALFCFNSVFHPLVHTDCRLKVRSSHTWAAFTTAYSQPHSEGAFAWRHDDLCPLCYGNNVFLPLQSQYIPTEKPLPDNLCCLAINSVINRHIAVYQSRGPPLG